MEMNRETMFSRYEHLRTLAKDPDGWLDSKIGGDLWIDGLNVFLSIEPNDFVDALEKFLQKFSKSDATMLQTLQALHRFCLSQAQIGEYELYQALAVGLTWLTLQPETNGQFFNVPVLITNHSVALLLSSTYQAVWAHSYNAGLELYVDLEKKQLGSLFRPEHGRIYQRTSNYARQKYVKYPFLAYFHEMSHILLFFDLYQRVLGTVEEERSYLTHLEACISELEERLLSDLLAVGHELNLVDDGFGDQGGFPQAGQFRIRVLKGEVDGVTSRVLDHFTKCYMQLGEDRSYIPENPVKERILQQHSIRQEQLDLIWPHYGEYIQNLQLHSIWGNKSGARNRIPAFREVVELVPLDAYCQQKLQESLDPNAWPTLQALYSKDPWPELDLEKRIHNKQLWSWRDLLSRLAEMRGFLSVNADQEMVVLAELYDLAQQVAALIRTKEPLQMTPDAHESRIERMRQEICDVLSRLSDEEVRTRLLAMIRDPFTYVLEPR